MWIYYANLLSIFLYGIIYTWVKDKRLRKGLIFVFAAQLVCLTGFRKYTVGVDTKQYYYWFRYLTANNIDKFWRQSSDKGAYIYKLLNYVVWKLGGSFQVVLFIAAIIAIAPVIYYICKNSKNIFLSFFIYLSFNYYLYTLITIRQSAAYGIILLSVNSIKKRKPFRFLILVLLAAGFHTSALFFLPAYLLYNMKINQKNIIAYILILAIVWVSRIYIARFIINNIFSDYTVEISNSYTYLFIHVLILVFGLLVYKGYVNKRYSDCEKRNIDYIYVYMMIGILLMIGCSVASNALRIAYFYTIQIVVFIPNVIAYISNTKIRFILQIGTFVLCFLIFGIFIKGFMHQNMDYVPFWN